MEARPKGGKPKAPKGGKPKAAKGSKSSPSPSKGASAAPGVPGKPEELKHLDAKTDHPADDGLGGKPGNAFTAVFFKSTTRDSTQEAKMKALCTGDGAEFKIEGKDYKNLHKFRITKVDIKAGAKESDPGSIILTLQHGEDAKKTATLELDTEYSSFKHRFPDGKIPGNASSVTLKDAELLFNPKDDVMIVNDPGKENLDSQSRIHYIPTQNEATKDAAAGKAASKSAGKPASKSAGKKGKPAGKKGKPAGKKGKAKKGKK